MCLQINTIKYNAKQEITNIYENFQIVWSQFCTDFLLFVYIRSTSNIYLFISIRIHCQRIQTNSFSVTFSYSQYLAQYSMNDPEGRKTTIRRYLVCLFLQNIFTLVYYFPVCQQSTQVRSRATWQLIPQYPGVSCIWTLKIKLIGSLLYHFLPFYQLSVDCIIKIFQS